MAIKKSELYSKLWEGCDALRGGMDASQYKDYVLTLLFIKYVSDKAAANPDALIEVPAGHSYNDILALKGKKDIGEKIDTTLGAVAKANDLEGVIDLVSFNDEEKLGKGKEMTDRLSDLVSIFSAPALDFSKNRAEGDDILGDAYEYLMRHFATDSGKSKGQFYTPAEVSRVIAKVIGIRHAKSANQTIYDPTCGSGSLLLKAAEESPYKVTIYGQEKDSSTAGLARMNLILHNNETGLIEKGYSTLSNPLFLDKDGYMKTFDFVVANPPFSSVNWKQGFDPANDEHGRFTGYGMPPEKNGDYAFLLHIVRSLKSTGKGAVILPHGVLFRGGAEGEIRKNLINKRYIKGIIGLPANLFYGTGIPACIIVLDKEGAEERSGIFMIDAGKGYIKDGNKNRLREQDIHKITDAFEKQTEIPGYSRMVPLDEIAGAKNEYNLNIPRYIDSQEAEDLQDIDAHLNGGIPAADVDALGEYWQQYPNMRSTLFAPTGRKGYYKLKVDKDEVKPTIYHHAEFIAFGKEMETVFVGWQQRNTKLLKALKPGLKPKQLVQTIAEDLLAAYTGHRLVDPYAVYQHLLDYWNETMQDDSYLLAVDGWKAETYRILLVNKKGAMVDKGWVCDLVPAWLVGNRYYAAEQEAIACMEAERETTEAAIQEMKEEHETEEGYFAQLDKVNKANALKRLKEIKKDKTAKEEIKVLEQYIALEEKKAELNAALKTAADELDLAIYRHYPTLTEADIKQLVVEDKWMATVEKSINEEIARISQRLAQRIKELGERYDTPLQTLSHEATVLEEKVNMHLQKMGYTCN